MLILQIFLFVVSFVAIWFGADLIVKSVVRFSKKLKISSFSASFFILGFLTSMPEIALGLTSISSKNPEIFVGNLIGGVVVIFLLVFPVLAILGKGVKISHDLNPFSLVFSLIVTALPALLVIDHRVTNIEAIMLILFYLALFYIIESKKGFLSAESSQSESARNYSLIDLMKIIAGMILIFISSHYIVDQTLYFSQFLHIPPLVISVLALSFGTNLPELSLAVKSIISGHKEIAFGNYMGSAAANTFLFGIFSLINQGEVITTDNFLVSFIFILVGMGLFFYFTRSKNDLSRKEGLFLFSLYILFVAYWLTAG
jgi:cation:H+ antiporter